MKSPYLPTAVAVIIGLASSPVSAQSGYCEAGADDCDEYIAQVTFVGINNASDCIGGPAVDYTGIGTSVQAGSSYPITVLNGESFYALNQVAVWIDWNQNFSFQDANESYEVLSPDFGQTFTATIHVPANALNGITRMRIRMMFTGTPEPCGTLDYGEVEDYTLVVQGGIDCNAAAGTLATQEETCLDDGTALLLGTAGGDAVIPQGYQLAYLLTEAPTAAIIAAGSSPEFEVTSAGTYTMHTLVHSPSTLPISTLQFGSTTASELNALLIQGGGSICASLFVTGATTTVVDCSIIGIAEQRVPAWSVFPNPGNGDITIRNDGQHAVVTVQVMDMSGRLLHVGTYSSNNGDVALSLAHRLAPGTYVLHLSSGQNMHDRLFVVR